MDENGKKISMADRLVKILSREERRYGVKGGGKSDKREANKKIEDQMCRACHHGNLDQEANQYLPLLNSKCQAKGFDVGPKFPGKPRKGEMR